MVEPLQCSLCPIRSFHLNCVNKDGAPVLICIGCTYIHNKQERLKLEKEKANGMDRGA